MSARLPVRARAAVAAGRLAGLTSRGLGRGSGEVVGGRLALRLAPDLLPLLVEGTRSACVSGTNGKTTTTRLLRAALATAGPVASNAGGANMTPGVVTALMAGRRPATAVLEVDEMYLPAVAAQVSPAAVVLLNITRDQLDRSNETRRIARRWREAGAVLPATTAVANVDDPLVVWAAQGFLRRLWVGAGQRWQLDAQVCPACGAMLERAGAPAAVSAAESNTEPAGGLPDGPSASPWHCPQCGLSRPEPAVRVTGPDRIEVEGTPLTLRLALPGLVNTGNAALAVAAAGLFGVTARAAAEGMAGVGEVQGRYAVVDLAGVATRLLLAKNPAGWQEMLTLLGQDPQVAVVLGFNARIADGRDPSWIWDVPLEQLRGRPVVVYGDRAADMSVRLAYAGVAHELVSGIDEAVRLAAGRTTRSPADRTVDLLATYTAFREVAGR